MAFYFEKIAQLLFSGAVLYRCSSVAHGRKIGGHWRAFFVARPIILSELSHLAGVMSSSTSWWFQISGQIIATSHDLTPNGGLVREIPLFQGNLGW